MNARRSVCAVVVTYNRADLLDVCLRALGNQTYAIDRIIIVDNASTDHTADVLDAYLNLDVVRLPSNAGSSGGFAAGIERAAQDEWDLVWVMDDDVEPEPDALAFLVDSMGPDVAASGPVKVGSDGQVQPLHIAQYNLARMSKRAVVPAEGETVDVSFLIVRRPADSRRCSSGRNAARRLLHRRRRHRILRPAGATWAIGRRRVEPRRSSQQPGAPHATHARTNRPDEGQVARLLRRPQPAPNQPRPCDTEPVAGERRRRLGPTRPPLTCRPDPPSRRRAALATRRSRIRRRAERKERFRRRPKRLRVTPVVV